ncbi:ATP-binding cassette domain-containing protein [Thiolinea disciformis]|uniref:ATP-binding cassette domain-containing protein n=1 Tax=Thiolinea disciformis TaxID=125614 RepID=UPI0003791B58|nr:ATP-binding cassette domain-containing protein [Thiolinea disciformis]
MLKVNKIVLQRGTWQRTYNFSVQTGEIVTIQGQSGAGKTALLMAIAGFEKIYEGEIGWQGKSLSRLAVEQRPIMMLFQDHNLFEHILVKDNLFLGLSREFDYLKQKMLAAAQALGIGELVERKPSGLSGGQRQRVGIIRALLRPEPLVLLDEPLAELDEFTRFHTSQWIKDHAKMQQKTVLLVTHQQEDVERIGDWNLVLD